MKVFNLQCEHGHGFEGWFGSEDDYRQQLERGLLTCPMCASAQVQRMPSAPRLNLGAAAPAQTPAPGAEPAQAAGAASPAGAAPGPAAQFQAELLQAVRHVLANTEDVGERFTDEARRIHYGETEHRNIRGQATPEQREALRDEGIEVYSLPVPAALKNPLQ